jgi:hypothetical protein
MLNKEHRLMLFEKRVLRRIFGSEREEVTEGWGTLLNEALHYLRSSPDTVPPRPHICELGVSTFALKY